MQSQPHYDDYDLKIKMDSFKGLETSGWAVHKAKSEAGCEKEERNSSPTVYVAVVGLFNKGKTFVLNQLMDSKLLDGFASHTEGLCMKTPLDRSLRGFTFIDTAGFDFPIEVLDGAELYEKQYFDAFMRDVIFNVANISIIVVNDVTLNDQIYLDAVRKNLKRMHMDTMAGERSGGEELSNSQDASGKSDVDEAIRKPFHKGSMFGELVVIHNFSLCQNLKQCKEAFRKQVSQNYKGILRSAEVAEGPSSSLDRKVSYEFYFTEPSHTHTGMRHLFLGRQSEGAALKKKIGGIFSSLSAQSDEKTDVHLHNWRTFTLLREWLSAYADAVKADPVTRVIDAANEVISQYFADTPCLVMKETKGEWAIAPSKDWKAQIPSDSFEKPRLTTMYTASERKSWTQGKREIDYDILETEKNVVVVADRLFPPPVVTFQTGGKTCLVTGETVKPAKLYAEGTVLKESKVFGSYKWVIDFNADVKRPLSLQFEKTIQNKEANVTMLVLKKEEAKSTLEWEEGDWGGDKRDTE